ncbi:MAG: GDSL-type esterase/lipase family protein [Prosthecobacter sp.]|uniref:SGNH/GDSL hydrolase family protein n=1 Tax=Prosthecobacter sp. TaxID=1965333 RepID=UPI003BB0C963
MRHTHIHLLPVLAAALLVPNLGKAEIAVKSGEKIAFLGDSITAGGWGNPAGYVRLVISGLEANGVKAEAIPAGVGGHKSDQMLARLDNDVLSKKPQWMTLSCGVNDVWHGPRGVPLDDAMAKSGTYDDKVSTRGTYKKNITAIIDQAQAAGVKPVMLTATVIQENLDSKENGLLAPYNAFLRELAKEKKIPLADLNAMFQERIKAENKPSVKVLTSDGVHMNVEGNKLMAVGVLQALGLNADELDKAKASWPPLEAASIMAAQKAAEAKAKAAAEKKAKEAADKAKGVKAPK